MKTTKVSEEYLITGECENDLIPKGTNRVIINYTSPKNIAFILYAGNKIEDSSSLKQTQEEVKEVAGLLKKLSHE